MTTETVSHYRLLRRLGGGGMGEVYEAEDLRLGRHVALKFLSANYSRDRQAALRFEQEARAASSLNHPHICTIHDFGEHDGQAFIVMELLEGESLSARLAKGTLEPLAAIEVGIQIADALDAAHRAGVIHRDITASNVFVTSRGDVKILDFGLAKVGEGRQRAPAPDADAPTEPGKDLATAPGAVMGTVAYMSPEQARGETLDARTDLFSLGAVLYQMTTGQTPFPGRTTVLVFDAILHRKPISPLRLNPAVPEELGRVIDKALEKDRRLRYQSALELKVDLERLRRVSERELAAAEQGESAVGEQAARLPAELPSKPRAGAESAVKPRPRFSIRSVAWLAVVAAAAAVFVVLWLREPPIPEFTPRQITTAAGWEAEPAFSPDGKEIAYVSNEKGAWPEVFVIDVQGKNAPVQLTLGPGPKRHPAWYPDGRIAFVWEAVPGQPAIYSLLPRPGGRPALVVEGGEDPAISPEGDRIAFVRKDESGDWRVVVAPLSEVRRITQLTFGRGDGEWDHREPAWSPDGKKICYRAHRGLWVVAAAGGGRADLITDEAACDMNPVWSHDGKHVYFTSSRGGRAALWRVTAKGGRPVPLTQGTGQEQQATLAPDGLTLAFSTLELNPDLFVWDLASGQPALMLGSDRDDMCPVFGIDSVFFVSTREGKSDLWKQSTAPPHQAMPAQQLTHHGGNVSHPSASPDGKWVAYYVADKRNKRDIWIVRAEGGTPMRFTTDAADDYHPAWSPEGTKIAFASNRTGGLHIWVGEVSEGQAAGEPKQITVGSETDRDQAPAWSPKGTHIAYVTQSSDRDWEVRIVDAEGQGKPKPVAGTRGARRVRWDKFGLLWVSGIFDPPFVSLRAFDSDTFQVKPFEPPIVFGDNNDLIDFDVSRDGGQLVFSREERRVGNIFVFEARHPF